MTNVISVIGSGPEREIRIMITAPLMWNDD